MNLRKCLSTEFTISGWAAWQLTSRLDLEHLELVEESPLFPILSSSTFDVWSKTQETFKRSTGKFLVFSTLSHDVETKITRLEVSSVPKFEKNIWHHPNRFPFKKKYLSRASFLFYPKPAFIWQRKGKEKHGKNWVKSQSQNSLAPNLQLNSKVHPKRSEEEEACQARKWRIKKCCSTCSSIRFLQRGGCKFFKKCPGTVLLLPYHWRALLIHQDY